MSPSTNIMGSIYLGGNYWATPAKAGYSENCTDVLHPIGICDGTYAYNFTAGCEMGICDYLALSNRTQNDSNPAPIVLLGTPADGYSDNSGVPANLTFNATASGVNALESCTLWHNMTGIWEANQTASASGTLASVNFTLYGIYDKYFVWNLTSPLEV